MLEEAKRLGVMMAEDKVRLAKLGREIAELKAWAATVPSAEAIRAEAQRRSDAAWEARFGV